MTKKRKRLFILMVSLLLTLLLCTAAAAREQILTDHPVTLTFQMKDGAAAIPGYAFKLYKVADVNAYAEMNVTHEFERYRDTVTGLNQLEELDQEGWRTLASTLYSYILRDAPAPAAQGSTGSDGTLVFEDLPVGLYLVSGGGLKRIGSYTYTAVPFMIFLPEPFDPMDDWNYFINVIPKYTKNYDPVHPDPGGGEDEPSTVTRKVLKLWNDFGRENMRPSEITVQLLRDGQVHDTVVLSDRNGWRFEWTGLGTGHDWQVVEQEVPGYTASIERSGITFTLTNSLPGPAPLPPAPPSGSTQTKLPQTGMLWWPVPLLFGAGCLCLIIGIYFRRRYEK